MEFKPLRDLVIVRELKEEERTESGIIIPETVKSKRVVRGEVLDKGMGCVEVAEGDIVLFDRLASSVELEENTYLLPEESILAVRNEDVD